MPTVLLSSPHADPWRRQFPNGQPVWDDWRFLFNDEPDGYDYLVAFDDLPAPLVPRCPRAHTVHIATEPRPVHQYDAVFCAQFGLCLTTDPHLVHPHAIATQPGLAWRLGWDQGHEDTAPLSFEALEALFDEPRDKVISVISSDKAFTPGHRARLEFARRLKDHFGARMDFFGRGHAPMADKLTALRGYRFHVALENSSIPHYFTEKVSDAVIAGCFPLYAGCPNLGDHVPKASFQALDINDFDGAVAAITTAIDAGVDRTHREALREARRRLMREHNLFPMLTRVLGAHARGEYGDTTPPAHYGARLLPQADVSAMPALLHAPSAPATAVVAVPPGVKSVRAGGHHPAFSIVVIARNEARTLPHLLNSLWPFRARRGDLLVVDTGSEDETRELARDFGCRVLKAGTRFASRLSKRNADRIGRHFSVDGEGPVAAAGERLFDFARAREWAAARAGHDVVWMLDAADVVDVFDLDFIDDAIRRGEAGHVGYELRLKDVSFRICRFYDRRFDGWEGRAHEGLYPRSEASSLPARAARLECPPDQLVVRHVRRGHKERNYLAGLALDAIDHPERPRWLHYLGRELHYQGFHRSAVAALESHAANEAAWGVERSSSLCHAGRSRLALGEHDAAVDLFERAFAIDSTWREPLLQLAEAQAARGDFPRAITAATAALSVARTPGHIEADQNYTWAPHWLLQCSLLRMGRFAEAREQWQACVRFAPHLRL